VGVQAASAVPAGGKALQQSAPFPHGAARFVRSGAGILGNAILVGLIGPPIDEAWMMVRNKHLPLGARQFADALSADARCIQHRLEGVICSGDASPSERNHSQTRRDEPVWAKLEKTWRRPRPRRGGKRTSPSASRLEGGEEGPRDSPPSVGGCPTHRRNSIPVP
jgi:hypothetical protein